jgi:pimeloyl-ACP methyl ester carboxylesterase
MGKVDGMLPQRVVLHGQEVAYTEIEGSGSVLLLVHGVGSSSRTWDVVLGLLADLGASVIVLDLPGHGASAKERGDYSLGAFANTIRDLLDHLGHERVVFVGHSLGGGIGMQFAYQYPQRCEGLVLVSSGGLGPEASMLLRAATLPGAEVVIPVISHPRSVSAISLVSRVAGWVGGGRLAMSDDTLRTLHELRDGETRTAFLATLRSVVDVSGQRVSALPKLAATEHLPTLLIWGDRDPIIPCEHAREAAKRIPDARLVIFRGAGHEPHVYDPERFADVLFDHVRQMAGEPEKRAG